MITRIINQLRSKGFLGRSRHVPAVAANTYAGVTVQPCLEACDPSANQKGKRYLYGEEPELPLKGCDTKKCRCRYRYHTDRRENDDRRFQLATTMAYSLRSDMENRRSKERADRRKASSRSQTRAYFNDY